MKRGQDTSASARLVMTGTGFGAGGEVQAVGQSHQWEEEERPATPTSAARTVHPGKLARTPTPSSPSGLPSPYHRRTLGTELIKVSCCRASVRTNFTLHINALP